MMNTLTVKDRKDVTPFHNGMAEIRNGFITFNINTDRHGVYERTTHTISDESFEDMIMYLSHFRAMFICSKHIDSYGTYLSYGLYHDMDGECLLRELLRQREI